MKTPDSSAAESGDSGEFYRNASLIHIYGRKWTITVLRLVFSTNCSINHETRQYVIDEITLIFARTPMASGELPG